MYRNVMLAVVVAMVAGVGTSYAFEPLFVVNAPENLTFVDMGQVATYLKSYYEARGVTKPEDVDKFYEIIHTHGAPEAGHSEAKVGLIIQDGTSARGSNTVPRGVLVITGRYDTDKVLSMMRSHYDEHCQNTGHTAKFSETVRDDGATMHRFVMPDGGRRREMSLVSFKNYYLVSSAAEGDDELLERTIDTIKNNAFRPVDVAKASVTYHLTMTDQEKALASKVIDTKYDQYKKGELKTVKKRKGVVGWFSNKIADHKIKFINEAMQDLGTLDVEVARAKDENVNAKNVKLSATFGSEDTARDVKRKLLRHLVKAIKDMDNPQDKLGMASNVKISCKGSQVFVDTDLNTAEEQAGTFALISAYVARAIIKN